MIIVAMDFIYANYNPTITKLIPLPSLLQMKRLDALAVTDVTKRFLTKRK